MAWSGPQPQRHAPPNQRPTSPVGWGDVATRRDLGALDNKIETIADRLDSKIEAVGERLDTRIEAVADRLDTKIDAVADRLDTTIDALADRLDTTIEAVADRLRSDLQRTFVTWMFAAQGAVIAAVGLLLALMR